MMPTMMSCSASVSPLYDSETTPSAVCRRTTIVHRLTIEYALPTNRRARGARMATVSMRSMMSER
jgi:hypothetical protein